MFNPNDPASLEQYSSAVTLSDMEVFIFPDLLFSLVCANIMSPQLWTWRNDSWFKDIETLKPYRRILRVKQFIMDNFAFNLDLDTWGLTTKDRELARFSSFIDSNALSQSNALFGYEGDKYYFDIDIRKHFGLDKYNSDVIPYWKTETVEAMTAFKYKAGYSGGAGECVSLSTLYAAALFVVARIPLNQIFLLATPLHSQNFIDVNDGVITNNRRIVTKAMWFNGTELSDKARRAVQNERITIIANNTGHIHTLYKPATISKDAFEHFSKKLTHFLRTDITFEILANFLRQNSKLQKCFQIAHKCCGKARYIESEKVYSYEHNSTYKVSDNTRDNLLHEIDEDEFYTEPIADRLMLNEVEEFFKTNKIHIDKVSSVENLKEQLHHCCYQTDGVMKELIDFCKIIPQLPDSDKEWITTIPPIEFDTTWSRDQIITSLENLRAKNPVADLAFTAFRDLARSPWKPFLKAALERNPVSVDNCKDLDIPGVFDKLSQMSNESIYDGTRLAQPDEVWNYARGDGLEKAICLVNIMRGKGIPAEQIKLVRDNQRAVVKSKDTEYSFETSKNLTFPASADFTW